MDLYKTTLLDLQSLFSGQNENKDLINLFCRDLMKRTIFLAFYLRNLEYKSLSGSRERHITQTDIISDIWKLSHFSEIADIFFPLDLKIIDSLENKKRNCMNNRLQNFIKAFSWDLNLKSQTDNNTVAPDIFELIFYSENLNNPGVVYTPYFFAYWMVQSCFQRHLAQIINITNFSLKNLSSVEDIKIEQLKKYISQIQVLDISVGSGTFYLAAFDFLMELHHYLFPFEENSTSYLKKILNDNLYGVDIDGNALVVCKIRLILRIFRENPSIQINDILEIITNINLKTGNTLVGFTTNPRNSKIIGNNDFNQLLFHGIKDEIINTQTFHENQKIFHWFIEFPKVFRNPEIPGFDLVIGNPPYIGYRFISEKTKRILKHLYPRIYTGLNDYYYYFILRANQLLAPNGSCVLIVARYFLEARYARKLRSQLFESKCIDTIIDFREFKIFPKGINSVILFMTKNHKSTKKVPVFILRNHKISTHAVLHELKTSFETLAHTKSQVLQNFSLIQAETKGDRFILVSRTLKDLLNLIENQGVPLDQVCDIGTGYHSGKDRIFSPNIIEENTGYFAEILEQDTLTRYPLEKEIIKSIVKTSNILPFMTTWNKKYVIFTKRGIKINNFPFTKQYLEKYKEILKRRYEVKKNLAKWYEIAQVRNSRIFNAKIKIICPYRSRVPRFAIDRNQRYSSIDCTSLIPKESKFPNIYFILGVLNSELIEFYLYVVAKKLDAQKIELYPKTISEIPLKIPQTMEEILLYEEITETTKSICDILDSLKLTPKNHQILLKYGKKGLCKINNGTHELRRLIKTLDMLVYRLYGMETKIETLRTEIINPSI